MSVLKIKKKKDYDHELRGWDKKIEGVVMDLKSEIMSLLDSDGCEIGAEEKYGVTEN